MRIDQLSLKNFRGIREGSFEFPRARGRPDGGNGSFNLLVGPNGSGKTSILEALAVAMSGFFQKIGGTDTRHIRPDDVHVVIKMVEGRAHRASHYPVRITATGALDGKPLEWTWSLDAEGGRTKGREAREMAEASRRMGIRAIDGWDENLPLLSYYSADRLWNEPKDMARRRKEELKERGPHEVYTAPKNEAEAAWDQFSKRIGGYSNSVNGRCSPRDLQRWLGFEDYKAYRQKKESVHAAIVKNAMRTCLPGVDELVFDGGLSTLLFLSKGNWVEFRHLSEGQRNMAALVGDIAWKAAQLNPHLGKDALKKTPGIVLVDELDMHLHPQWQRMIVRKLQEIFPQIQFICATHSPQIVGEVPAEEIRVLADGGDSSPVRSMGVDSSRILEEIMEARPRREEDQKLIADVARVMDREDFPEVERLLAKLGATLGEDDPEVTRVRTLMAFLQDTR